MKIYFKCILLACSSIQLFGQTNDDTERGIKFYNSEKYKRAITCFKRAAKSGDAEAQTYLGFMYCNGKGVKKDTLIAINMYNRAIAKNFERAMVQLGNMYLEGNGVTKNLPKAFEMYNKAADLKYDSAMYIVGLCYEDGMGVTRDSIKAFNYFNQASVAGNKQGHERLAYCYYQGNGTEKNFENAVKYLELADSDRSDFGTYLLADMYYKGAGTTASPIKAEELLTRIIERNTDAIKLYPEVKNAADRARYQMEIEKMNGDVDTMPEFPGGSAAMISLFRKT